jgi:hypothetical protein
MTSIESRVAIVAEAALADQRFVTPTDVLVGLGWLTPAGVSSWMKGDVSSLERCLEVSPSETADALATLKNWATAHELRNWDTDYRGLKFSARRDPVAERISRTRWAAAKEPAPLIPPRRSREFRATALPYPSICSSCDSSAEILIKAKKGALCFDCVGLGHLVFLPSADAALTRRAKRASFMSAVVVCPTTRHYLYERLGILVPNDALELAAQECLNDADARSVHDQSRDDYAEAIRSQFPGCPPARGEAIAYHAVVRSRGGRRRLAPACEPTSDAVRLAVSDSVRHIDTDYDDLLMSGVEPDEARKRVQNSVVHILDSWRNGVTALDYAGDRLN